MYRHEYALLLGRRTARVAGKAFPGVLCTGEGGYWEECKHLKLLEGNGEINSVISVGVCRRNWFVGS